MHIDLINPATELVIQGLDQVDAQGVDDAVARAKVAQRRWAALPPAGRAEALRSLAAPEHRAALADPA